MRDRFVVKLPDRRRSNVLYGFEEWSADLDYLTYGGTWVRPSKRSSTAFYFIRAINWADAGRDAREVGAKYSLELAEVELAEISAMQVASALECCSVALRDIGIPLLMAAARFDYGCYALLRSENSDNFHKTFRALARYAAELDVHDERHEEAMNRPVNKIGSTAREYMRGDMNSALVRLKRG